MKTLLKILAVMPGVLLFFSCQDKIEETYKVNTPVYMTYNDLRISFKVAGGESIIQPGKIYFKDNYIFVNEYQKGIHVIDNTNPEDPKVIKFIEIPGNVDMAIKGTMLYADSYVDLLTIDISNMNDIREVDRDTNVFPYIIPEYESGILEQIDQSRGVITGYKVEEKTEKVDGNNIYYNRFPMWDGPAMYNSAGSAQANKTGGNDFGVGGSMARFTLYSHYLYTVNDYSLKLFDISAPGNPSFSNDIYVGWDIETIFPYEDNLFMGSQTGMYIYSLANPFAPEQIVRFRHASACDPVVVSGNYAYVTLRSGNLCGAIESQLDVVDISNISNPQLLKTYAMVEPYGLGIDNPVLFVCDGNAGLKIYNASDPLNIAANKLAEYPDIHAFDVIPLGNVLVLIGTDGLYQYDYSDPENIHQLSHIPLYIKN